MSFRWLVRQLVEIFVKIAEILVNIIGSFLSSSFHYTGSLDAKRRGLCLRRRICLSVLSRFSRFRLYLDIGEDESRLFGSVLSFDRRLGKKDAGSRRLVLPFAG